MLWITHTMVRPLRIRETFPITFGLFISPIAARTLHEVCADEINQIFRRKSRTYNKSQK